VEGVLRAEAHCDGVLRLLAEVAIEWLAAGALMGAGTRPAAGGLLTRARKLKCQAIADLGEAELSARMARVLALREAHQRLRAEVAEPIAIERRMRQHGLDWLELAGDELCFSGEGAAREARLLITADGETPAEVADRADVPVAERRLLVDEAPPALGVALAAAAVGEVIGPWEEAGRWRVLHLRTKTPPSPERPSLRERAIEELLKERTRRHAAGRTTLHVEL
jgi:hypothetical protein